MSSADNLCKQFERRSGQALRLVRPDLDPNYFYTLIVFLKEFLEKDNFEKDLLTTKSMNNYPGGRGKEFITCYFVPAF